MTTANGPAFWDSLLGPTGGQYPEYVSTDIFFGEYVALLEQDNTSESNGKASTPGSSRQSHQLKLRQKLLVRATPADCGRLFGSELVIKQLVATCMATVRKEGYSGWSRAMLCRESQLAV